MGLDNPWALLILIALVPILVALRRSELRTRNVLRVLKNHPPPRYYFVLRYALVSIFIGSLILVASRPYIEPQSTGDIIFLADTSRSMQARNSCSEPTYLERSKGIMRDVLTGVPEGRFGIVAFDRLAFPITQITYDHTYLKDAIDNALFIGMTYQATRTDIANALSVVAQKKQNLPDIYGNVRYVILLSDGYLDNSDWREGFEEALKQLQWANIKFLVVGVGNPIETPIHITSPDGECSREIIEIDGQEVRIPLRSDILTFIASETQGRYFEEGQTEELVSFIRSEALVDVPAEGVAFSENQRNNIGRVFLIPATIALLLFLML